MERGGGVKYLREVLWYTVDYFLGVVILSVCVGLPLILLSAVAPAWIRHNEVVAGTAAGILGGGMLLLGVRTGWKMHQRTGARPLAAAPVGIAFALLAKGMEWLARHGPLYVASRTANSIEERPESAASAVVGYVLLAAMFSGLCALGALLASRRGGQCTGSLGDGSLRE
jgi:cytochrome c biogenesis protein CcdA